MKYGTITRSIHTQDGIIIQHEERIVNTSTVYEQTTYCESVMVKNEQQALAEFLKLLDDHKAGKNTDFGIQCHAKDGIIHRVEKSWTV